MSDNTTIPDPAMPAPFVARIENYVNDRGYLITRHVVVTGTVDPSKQFIGHGEVSVAGVRKSYRFPIEADTLERAFELFEPAARAAGENEARQLTEAIRRHQSAIHPVPASALGGLLGPDGKPL